MSPLVNSKFVQTRVLLLFIRVTVTPLTVTYSLRRYETPSKPRSSFFASTENQGPANPYSRDQTLCSCSSVASLIEGFHNMYVSVGWFHRQTLSLFQDNIQF